MRLQRRRSRLTVEDSDIQLDASATGAQRPCSSTQRLDISLSRDANQNLARSYELWGLYIDDVRDSLADRDAAGFQRASDSNSGKRAIELRAAWRTKVIVQARRTGLDVPPWVNRVGTRIP
jgi:hypothetical protein